MKHVRLALTMCATGLMCLASCKDKASGDDQQQHIKDVVAAGGVVDSILPIPVMLDRFRAEAGANPDTLRHASTSVKALVGRWARALAASDTAELNAMLLDRAEFAWLYYEGSKMSKPPYQAPPQLLWGQMLATSEEGAQSLLKNLAGKALKLEDVGCSPGATEGENTLHEGCTVQFRIGGALEPPRAYFGTIIERGKRFKFVSYANRA